MPGSEYVKAVFLGIVQGVAEFLPISSSGHLVILQEPVERWLGLHASGSENMQLNIALHLGTLFSILVVYRAEMPQLLTVGRAVVIATIPIVFVGFAVKVWLADTLEAAFSSPILAGVSLLVTAALLFLAHHRQQGDDSLENIKPAQALTIGFFQALALVPGISRSGSTIAAGCLGGLDRRAATSFSFFIAIPAIMGASILSAWEVVTETSTATAAPSVLAVGALTSFLVGLAALRWLLRLISQRRLHWFAWYCLIAASATITWQLLER